MTVPTSSRFFPMAMEYALLACSPLGLSSTCWVPWLAAWGARMMFLAMSARWEMKVQQVTSNSKTHVQFRALANPGIWCSSLVPLVLLAGCKTTSSELYKLLCWEGVFLFGSSLLVVQTVACPTSPLASEVPLKPAFIPTLTLATLATITTAQTLHADYWTCLVVSVLVQLTFCKIVAFLVDRCPQSFTLGEALVLSQALVLFNTWAVLDLCKNALQTLGATEDVLITTFAEVVLLSCEAIVALGIVVPSSRTLVGFCSICSAVAAMFTFPCLVVAMQQNPLLWFLHLLTANSIRIALLTSWVLLTAGAVLLVMRLQNNIKASSSAVRKVFHGMLLCVFVPGFVFDAALLRFCSLITFGVFILVEYVRVARIPPVGDVLHGSLQVFLDEKDQGVLILTHIYLLLGCFFPLWLQPILEGQKARDVVLCGILSVGIGDAAASIGGSCYGRLRLPSTKKTVEGTLSSFIVQLLSFLLIHSTGSFQLSGSMQDACLAILFSSMLEATTLQVDNIIIPLFTYVIWLDLTS